MYFQPILLIQKDLLDLDNKSLISELKKKISIDINQLNLHRIRSDKSTLGIEQVQSSLGSIWTIHEELYTVIIERAEQMSEEAQNSILKTLEEPPRNTLLILITDNLSSILDTIKSRCNVLLFEEGYDESTEESELFEKFLSAKYIARLKVIDQFTSNIKSRELAIKFCNYLVKKIYENKLNYDILLIIKQVMKYLNSNVSVKIALEYLALKV